jgi:DNA polymerase I-like protein with 3'-5' exonuclease and polymerase domains
MTMWCDCCEKWSALPADGGQGERPLAPCEHCGATLAAQGKYNFCSKCRRYHHKAYEVCPHCSALPISTEVVQETFAVEMKKRRARRGEEYYLQLYIDYKDQADKAAASAPEPTTAPSTNSNADGYVNLSGEGNPHVGAVSSLSGNGTSGNGHHDHANGNGNVHVDLAISDSVPLTLFGEDGSNSDKVEDRPAPISAGSYNDFDYELIQDPSRLAVVAEMLARETVVGIDTETTGLDPYSAELLLLQIATADKVYVVDCKRIPPLALKPFLENPRVLKVAQNAKFEYEMLRQQTGITLCGVFDTMLAERLLTAGISREISLKAIAQKYIGAYLDKSVRESFYKLAASGDAYLAPEQLHYAARDAFIMMPIWRDQVKELKKQALEQVADIEFRCIAAVGDMELAGVRIDEGRWRKIIEDVAVQRDKASQELCEMLAPATMQTTMFGVPSINLNSNTQLIEALAKLGVMLPDTMEATLTKYSHPAVSKLLEYRGHEKTLSAFGENVLSLINPKTRRIHPDFNQYGADTGRFSCTRPNVQQIPATSDFRKCFVAAEGYKLVTCDYSQCELRVLAELSGDEGFVSAFKSGGDLHSLTASQMFGVPLEEVQKPQRNAAKAINFGLAYGMGPSSLAVRIGVSSEEGKDLVAKYFKAYPGIQRWLEKAAKDAVRLGYSATMLGRKRFYNLPDESLKRTSEDDWRKQIAAIERQGKNSPIQGCNADMTKLALIYLRSALKDWDARTVNTVHDEIVVEVRADQAEEVQHIVEDAMLRAGQDILKVVPIVAEAAVADYWSK